MKGLVAILAKQPMPGRVKTRLAKDVGPERAAVLAEAFLLDTIDVAAQVPGADVLIAFDPPDAKAWFCAHAPSGCEVMPQPRGDLGDRIAAVFERGFALGAASCVAIGMDTPQLSPGRLAQALSACENGSVTIGPSVDGGYYLIGMDRPRPTLFDGIDWSTDAVFDQTSRRIRRAGAPLVLLPEEHDVDDLAGLQALEAGRLPPRSRAALLAFQDAWKG